MTEAPAFAVSQSLCRKAPPVLALPPTLVFTLMLATDIHWVGRSKLRRTRLRIICRSIAWETEVLKATWLDSRTRPPHLAHPRPVSKDTPRDTATAVPRARRMGRSDGEEVGSGSMAVL